MLEMANEIGKEIRQIAKQIDTEHWIKTGQNIPVDDFMPEIVSAVIYVLNRLEKKNEN